MSVLLLMADGRFPAGGHAHSGGLEEAVASGRVANGPQLLAFLRGRLSTTGTTDAGLAAAASQVASGLGGELAALDAEASARCPSPALRQASRAQGRGLLRAALTVWPPSSSAGTPLGPTAKPPSLMYPVAVGVAGWLAGLSTKDTALVAAQASVSGPAWAATRLLGLSPYTVVGCLAALAPSIDEVASRAAGYDVVVERTANHQGGAFARLPAWSAPLLDLGAEAHSLWEVKLFAS